MTTVDPRSRANTAGVAEPDLDVRPASAGFVGTIKAYIALTKPRIIETLLVTTVPTMVLAAGGMPPLLTVIMTVVGGTLAAGSANALNCYLDRDIDAVMNRTAHRPLATGAIPAGHAMVFSLFLGVTSVVLLATTVNPLAAELALAAILFYVFVYTLLLKRRTAQNIVWGGAAGCMPVLIGWAAVTGGLSWQPLVLFGVIFLWTPPHYWPLSMRFREDYAAARVPMLPVVASEVTVARQSVLYAWAMVAVSLLLAPATGVIYLATAVLAGGAFLVEAHRLLGRARRAREGQNVRLAPMRLFHLSITYLTLLFTAVAVDPFLRIPLF